MMPAQQTQRHQRPKRLAPADVAGRVPPHDLDAEAAVLSAILLDPQALDRVVDTLQPADFYSDANGKIFTAAMALSASGTPIDIISVASYLRSREQLAQIGGASYLAQLSDATPAVAHVGAHANVVGEKAHLRRIIATCQTLAAEAYGDVGATRAWIAEAEATFAAVAEAPDAERIPTLADGICDRVDDIIAAEGQPGDAITTGIADLDRLMGPTAPGAFVIIGAHSGVGKTSLAMQMASHVASCCTIDGQAAGALVISQEMMLAELADRAICGALDMDTRTISSGRLGAAGMTRITGAAEVVRTRPSALRNIWVDDRPSVSPEQLRVRARQVMREAKDRGVRLAVIFVDYLQLCDGSDGGKRSFERAEREFSYISKELKKLAKRLRVVIVALAQLNEDAREEQRYPRGEDFSQCKALRHDADRVLLIHNETALARRVAEVDDRDQPGDLPPEVAQIIVDKNRGGREGLIHCLFSPSRSSFYDMAVDDRRAYVAERKREREAQRAAGRGRRGGGR